MEKGKNILTQFLDFFVYSNLLISIASFLFTLQTALLFNYTLAAAAFFSFTNFISTFAIYNIQRVYQSTRPHSNPRLYWYERHKRLLFTLILVFGSLYFLVFKANYLVFKEGLLFYAPAGLLSLFYFLPPFTLRRLPFFKIILISSVWAYSSVFIPLLYTESTYSAFAHFKKDELAYMLAQLFFIAALCVPFDIRDVENDRQNSVKTLPVHFGLSRAKTIGIILFLAYMVLAQDTRQAIAYFICGTLGIVLLLYSTEHRHRYYYSVLVDGLIILQFMLFNFLLAG